MTYAIIFSTLDPAGMNIHQHLLALGAQDREDLALHTIDIPCIDAEHIDKELDADCFIFATTHKSKSENKALCVHSIGNWGDDTSLGGEARMLAPCMPALVGRAYLCLQRNAPDEFTVSLEATHHGPAMDKPSMFIEIGSIEEHWTDPRAGEAIAKTILEITQPAEARFRVAIGIGGTHYCANIVKGLEKDTIAIGHVCPKYALESLDATMLKQAIEKTPECSMILLDYKGLGSHKARIKELLEDCGLDVVRTDKVGRQI